jgi:hypothetical protein
MESIRKGVTVDQPRKTPSREGGGRRASLSKSPLFFWEESEERRPWAPYRVQGAPAVDLVARVEVRRERGVAAAGPACGARLAVQARDVGRHEAGDTARRGVALFFHALAIDETVAKARRSGSAQDGGHEEDTSRTSASHDEEARDGRPASPLMICCCQQDATRAAARCCAWLTK